MLHVSSPSTPRCPELEYNVSSIPHLRIIHGMVLLFFFWPLLLLSMFFCFVFFSPAPPFFSHPKVTHVPISQDLRSVTERSDAVTSVSVPEYVFAAPVRHGSSSSRQHGIWIYSRRRGSWAPEAGYLVREKSCAILVAYVG